MPTQSNPNKWREWIKAQSQKDGWKKSGPTPSIVSIEDLHLAARGAAARFMHVAFQEQHKRDKPGSRFSVEKYGRPIWFRGDSEWLPTYSLHPRIYRNDLWAKTEHGRRSAEKWMLSEFEMKAVSRHTPCPRGDEGARWLCLAQHWHLPTRLLDWSESILNAAWFATHDDRKDTEINVLMRLLRHNDNLQRLRWPRQEDVEKWPAQDAVEINKFKKRLQNEEGQCVIWALSPTLLNFFMVGEGPFHFLEGLPDVGAAFSGSELWDIVGAAHKKNCPNWPTRPREEELKSNVNERVLAVWAPQVDSRMLAQHAAFTVHASPNDLWKAKDKNRFLIKFSIPREKRKCILDDLRKAGTRQSTVYPDLGHLAADLEEEWREIVAKVDERSKPPNGGDGGANEAPSS
ncbi:MAG: FRG domain-containing protein [Planctomycetota bacterium]|nr:FRG domain-containing protein [Planctomycetota bacterium]